MVLSRSPTWLQNTSTTIKRTAESAPSVTPKTGLFAQVGPGTTGSAGRESRATGLAELAAGSAGFWGLEMGESGMAALNEFQRPAVDGMPTAGFIMGLPY